MSLEDRLGASAKATRVVVESEAPVRLRMAQRRLVVDGAG